MSRSAAGLSWGKVAIVAALAAAVVGVVWLKQLSEAPTTPVPAAPARAAAPATAKATNLPRLLDLGSTSCIPCKMMAPVLADLRKTYAGKLQVDFIDVWKDKSAGDKYGIEAIPTQILFDAHGKELFRHTGFYSKEDILAKFHGLGVRL